MIHQQFFVPSLFYLAQKRKILKQTVFVKRSAENFLDCPSNKREEKVSQPSHPVMTILLLLTLSHDNWTFPYPQTFPYYKKGH